MARNPERRVPADVERLEKIEDLIIDALESTGQVMTGLSRISDGLDRAAIQESTQAFLTNISQAQDQLIQAMKSYRQPLTFEQNCYPTLLQVLATSEKIRRLQAHLSRLGGILQLAPEGDDSAKDTAGDT